MGDGLAQGIQYYDTRQFQQQPHTALHHPVHEHLPPNLQPACPQQIDTSYDWLRTLRFASYNFCVAPIAGSWYILLDRLFPSPSVSSHPSRRAINWVPFKRMVVDQVVFSPAGLALFFSVMGYLETKSLKGIKEKFQDAYATALVANYKVWPLVQWINFAFVPLAFRLPFVNSIGILWNAYLSWLNNASKQHEERRQRDINHEAKSMHPL
ncbi:hypothetical protein DM01DRAFT_1337967 [Hesseltinella vesiculosa]|uniref:Protein SYM1 n=1 Tax=Hesseltinella vesiculosa TaxID=101127 RepID=A0A1X2GBF4_9FUNG|nr:hypothetical protein DM01DRAFT_1337967 [Hesseltinella vesiculosa]